VCVCVCVCVRIIFNLPGILWLVFNEYMKSKVIVLGFFHTKAYFGLLSITPIFPRNS
jgi:hypothetical protein